MSLWRPGTVPELCTVRPLLNFSRATSAKVQVKIPFLIFQFLLTPISWAGCKCASLWMRNFSCWTWWQRFPRKPAMKNAALLAAGPACFHWCTPSNEGCWISNGLLAAKEWQRWNPKDIPSRWLKSLPSWRGFRSLSLETFKNAHTTTLRRTPHKHIKGSLQIT